MDLWLRIRLLKMVVNDKGDSDGFIMELISNNNNLIEILSLNGLQIEVDI